MHNSRPSLSAIKYTVVDNKTADISDKNCSLSTVLTATLQHVQGGPKKVIPLVQCNIISFTS